MAHSTTIMSPALPSCLRALQVGVFSPTLNRQLSSLPTTTTSFPFRPHLEPPLQELLALLLAQAVAAAARQGTPQFLLEGAHAVALEEAVVEAVVEAVDKRHWQQPLTEVQRKRGSNWLAHLASRRLRKRGSKLVKISLRMTACRP